MPNRRNLLKGMAAAAALSLLPDRTYSTGNISSGTQDMIKPSVLSPGDKVAVIAPGTAVSDPDDLARMKEALDYFGLQMQIGASLQSGSGYKTRTAKERAADLHTAFKDPEIKGVFCIRGGYGSATMLNEIDYSLIRKNPKIFLGYSDITAMHLAITKKAGLVTFHGPVLLSSFTNYTVNYFRKALFSKDPVGEIMNPDTKSGFRTAHPVRTVKGGTASGKLTGGNLSIICSLMGTEYEIDTKGKILFIEDVGEEPYRIDRMLTQLKLSGKLKDAAGIVFGECSGCEPARYDASRVWDYSLGEVIDNAFSDFDKPVLYGLTIGHTSDQATLPIGVEAELDADKGILRLSEAGVV